MSSSSVKTLIKTLSFSGVIFCITVILFSHFTKSDENEIIVEEDLLEEFGASHCHFEEEQNHLLEEEVNVILALIAFHFFFAYEGILQLWIPYFCRFADMILFYVTYIGILRFPMYALLEKGAACTEMIEALGDDLGLEACTVKQTRAYAMTYMMAKTLFMFVLAGAFMNKKTNSHTYLAMNGLARVTIGIHFLASSYFQGVPTLFTNKYGAGDIYFGAFKLVWALVLGKDELQHIGQKLASGFSIFEFNHWKVFNLTAYVCNLVLAYGIPLGLLVEDKVIYGMVKDTLIFQATIIFHHSYLAETNDYALLKIIGSLMEIFVSIGVMMITECYVLGLYMLIVAQIRFYMHAKLRYALDHPELCPSKHHK